MKILLAVTGSIAAYKMASLVSILDSKDHQVQVVMTRQAEKFITLYTMSTMSRRVVITDEEDDQSIIKHIYYPQEWADCFVVAPSTANIIGKFANGIADDMVSSMYLACPTSLPKLIFPAMNTYMLESKPVARNMVQLIEDGCYIGGTEKKKLACGYGGYGALADIKYIVDKIEKIVLG